MKKILHLLLTSGVALANGVASGKLVLPKSLTAKSAGIRTVFITVFDPKATRPMPCAAQKFELTKNAEGEFLRFSLDTASLTMMGCPEIPTVMNLKARLDQDGSAGPDAPGDIVGKLADVKTGAKNLKIEMSQAIE
ncbi:MAG: hypothetical protein HYR96_00225 [Deltaproteobacteria bacterium]|nr:hypothetical protein [Deltaproteobacteria bacterium]MBI3293406.1 hypothetical protein [Deltaproteobacteria bacterium]